MICGLAPRDDNDNDKFTSFARPIPSAAVVVVVVVSRRRPLQYTDDEN